MDDAPSMTSMPPAPALPERDATWSAAWVRHLADTTLWRRSPRSLSVHGAFRAWREDAAMDALMRVFAASDAATWLHCRRTAQIVRIIAGALGAPAAAARRAAALAHDIGKVCLSSTIWHRREPPGDAAIAAMREHAVVGAALLACIPDLQVLAPLVRSHHERYDGDGYPDRLSGESIPLESRIIAVADAYDAMRTSRAYRAALSPDAIRCELQRGRGAQWDPSCVDALLAALDHVPSAPPAPSVAPDRWSSPESVAPEGRGRDAPAARFAQDDIAPHRP